LKNIGKIGDLCYPSVAEKMLTYGGIIEFCEDDATLR